MYVSLEIPGYPWRSDSKKKEASLYPPWVQYPLYPPNAHSILGYIQKKSELEWAQRQWAREHEVTNKLEDIRQDTVTKVDNGVY